MSVHDPIHSGQNGLEYTLIQLRMGNAVLLSLSLVVIFMGLGFHLRQGWVGFQVGPNSTDRIVCGMQTNHDFGSDACDMKGFELLVVSSLQGHVGTVHTNMYNALKMDGQYFCISWIILVLASIAAMSINQSKEWDVVSASKAKKQKEQRYRFPIKFVLLIGMTIVAILEFHYGFCAGYAKHMKSKYSKNINEMRMINGNKNNEYVNISHPVLKPVSDENIVVECRVIAFTAAGFMSILSAFLLFMDVYYVFCKDQLMIVAGENEENIIIDHSCFSKTENTDDTPKMLNNEDYVIIYANTTVELSPAAKIDKTKPGIDNGSSLSTRMGRRPKKKEIDLVRRLRNELNRGREDIQTPPPSPFYTESLSPISFQMANSLSLISPSPTMTNSESLTPTTESITPQSPMLNKIDSTPCSSVVNKSGTSHPSLMVNKINVTLPSRMVNKTDVTRPSRKLNQTDVTPPSRKLNQTDVTPPSRKLNQTDVTRPSRKLNQTDATPTSRKLNQTGVTRPSRKLNQTDATPTSGKLNQTGVTPPSRKLNQTDVTPPSRKLNQTDVTPPSRKLNQTGVTPPSRKLNQTDVTLPSRKLNQSYVTRPSRKLNQTDVTPPSRIVNQIDVTPPSRKLNQTGVTRPSRKLNQTDATPTSGKLNQTGVTPPSRKLNQTDVTLPSRKLNQSYVTRPSRKLNQTDVTPPSRIVNQIDVTPPSRKLNQTDVTPDPSRIVNQIDVTPTSPMVNKTGITPSAAIIKESSIITQISSKKLESIPFPVQIERITLKPLEKRTMQAGEADNRSETKTANKKLIVGGVLSRTRKNSSSSNVVKVKKGGKKTTRNNGINRQRTNNTKKPKDRP